MRDLLRILLMGSFLFCLLAPTPILAADTNRVRTTLNCQPAASKTTISYPLPSPGMLLDHRMYVFKNMRDTLLEGMIRNPTKSVEFQILQSDKFLSMGSTLFLTTDKWKWVPIAIERSRNSAQKAYGILVKIKSAGQPLPTHQKDTLETSIRKHIEVVSEMRCHTISPSLETALMEDTNAMGELLDDLRELH